MRAVKLLLRLSMFRSFFVCALAATAGCFFASAQTTTFTGTVYSPLGPPPAGVTNTAGYGDPIPNILVFIADPNSPPPAFSQGVTVPTAGQNGCSAQPSLVPATVLGEALTGADGTFSFTTAGALPATVQVYIQAGKWRKHFDYPSSQFTLGGINTLPTMSMPSAQQAGVADLPHIAVVTGGADQVECIFRQIGIQDSEFSDPGGRGSINLFVGDGRTSSKGTGGGEAYSSKIYSEGQLLNSGATGAVPISNYDMVIFGCTGAASSTVDPAPTNANGANPNYQTVLEDYTSEGGRIFLTHYEYRFLEYTSAFSNIASWYTKEPVSLDSASGELGAPAGQLPYTEAATLQSWMQNVKALNVSTTPPEFLLTYVREDISKLNAPAQSWAYLPNQFGKPVIQFTFDTPIGAAGTPTLDLNYTNHTTQFLRGDTADSITLTVTNSSTTPTTGTMTLALSLPSALVNPTLVDSSGGTWQCVTSPTVSCTNPAVLAPGATDSVLLTFGISSTASLGQVSLTAALSGGGINDSSQCGRVLFNDYHVENPATLLANATLYNNGSHCTSTTTTGLNAAQKFLEYSLYNLSNFVSPSTTDLLQIQEKPVVTWAPASQYYYGTPPEVYENATSDLSSGSFSYVATPAPGSTYSSTLWDSGTYSVVATFTPTDTTNYTTSSQTATVKIVPAPTKANVTNQVNPIFYGQEIGYDPVQGDAQLLVRVVAPATYLPVVEGGTFQVTIDGTVACSGTEGQAITGGSRPGACPDAGFLGWNAGAHTFELSYGGDIDFLAATPYVGTVTVNPDPTVTTVASSNASAVVRSNVTFTGTVANAYATTVGSVAFYDSATAVTALAGSLATPNVVPSPAGAKLIGTGTLANGTASVSLSNLLVGTHYIVACLVGAQNTSGTYNFQDSCSGSIAQVIEIPPSAPEGTASYLTTSENPSAVGQAVSFTATVQTTGAITSVPTGTVAFTADGAPLGTGPLGADGTAVVTTSSLTLGSHAIVAKYAGSSTMAASVSATLTQVVEDPLTAAGTGFLMNLTPSPTVDVGVGGSGLVSIQVVDLTNFSQAVQLSCSGLPAQAQCIFAQSLVPAGGGTTQVLVTASAPHACNSTAQYFSTSGLGGWGWPMFGVGMLTLCLAGKRRKLQAVALTLLLVAVPGVLSGCGGNCTNFGVKPGDYSFTIKGTSNGSPSIVKSQTLTMHVHL